MTKFVRLQGIKQTAIDNNAEAEYSFFALTLSEPLF